MCFLKCLVLIPLALATPIYSEEVADEKPVIKITVIEEESQTASVKKQENERKHIPENAFDANDTSTRVSSTDYSGTEAWVAEETDIQFLLLGFLGLQTDNLDWTVKLGATTEKTSWENVQSTQVGIAGHIILNEHIFLFIDYRQALNHSGDVDNSLNSPVTQISGSSDDGGYQRYSLGFCYRFALNDEMSIGPRLGFFESDQDYQIKNSDITAPSVNAIVEGLDSRFETTWNGMLVGGEFIWQVNEQFSWSAMLDLSILDYAATGRLNLRPDLKRKSFTQSGDGIGIDLYVACTYQHNQQLGFQGFLHYADWNVDGDEERYPSTGGTVKSNLEESHFTSLLIGGGVSYEF